MENRKEAEIELIVNHINSIWELDIDDKAVLESALYVLLRGESSEKRKAFYYLSEGDENGLLDQLDEEEIKWYAENNLDMIEEDDQKSVSDFDNEDLLEEVEYRGLSTDGLDLDIVSQSVWDDVVKIFRGKDREKIKYIERIIRE